MNVTLVAIKAFSEWLKDDKHRRAVQDVMKRLDI